MLKELLNLLNESTCTQQNSETFKELLQRVACIETRIKTWRDDFVEPGILHNTMVHSYLSLFTMLFSNCFLDKSRQQNVYFGIGGGLVMNFYMQSNDCIKNIISYIL